MRLSVVVPAYEERDRIGETVRAIHAALRDMGEQAEVIVVDDGSRDDTTDQARQAGAEVVLRRPVNEGKGAAVRAGVLAASGDTVAFIDADLAYRPEQLLGLLARVEAGADVVVGSRRHPESVSLEPAVASRAVAGRVFSLLCRGLGLTDLSDTQCGIKAFAADPARDLFARSTIKGFAFDVEILYLARRAGYRVEELPVELTNSARSTVRAGRQLPGVLADVLWLRWRTIRQPVRGR